MDSVETTWVQKFSKYIILLYWCIVFIDLSFLIILFKYIKCGRMGRLPRNGQYLKVMAKTEGFSHVYDQPPCHRLITRHVPNISNYAEYTSVLYNQLNSKASTMEWEPTILRVWKKFEDNIRAIVDWNNLSVEEILSQEVPKMWWSTWQNYRTRDIQAFSGLFTQARADLSRVSIGFWIQPTQTMMS